MALVTDPLIELPGRGKIRVSEITASPATRIRWLGPYQGNDGDVRCLCRPGGVPMGVGHRQQPCETYYLYPLHRTDAQRHSLGCPHRTSHEKSANSSSPDSNPAVEIYGGYVNVDLASSLAKLYREPRQDGAQSTQASPKQQPRPPRTGSISLLAELLWSQAALNQWHPGFQGKRSYAVIRNRLLNAARTIAVRRRPLYKRFYVPPPFYEKRRDQINEELTGWLAVLRREKNKQPYGFLGGLLKAVVADGDEAHALRLANFPKKVYLDRAGYTKLDDLIQGDTALDDEAAPFVLALVHLEEKTTRLTAVETTAIALTREYLPVDSQDEALLLERLIEERRQFRRPLRSDYIDAPTDTPRPVALLEDRDDRMCLEIFREMGNPSNVDQFERRKNAYLREGQAVWWWDPAAEIEPPALPEKLGRPTRRA